MDIYRVSHSATLAQVMSPDRSVQSVVIVKVTFTLIVIVTMEASSSNRYNRYWRVRKGRSAKGPDIGSRNITNMVAEPDSDLWQRQARKRIQALEKKVKDLESAVKENMARGVLTNVQVNHLRVKIAKQTKEHVKESSETEEKTVTKTLVKPDFETIISETVNMEGTNVKAVIGPRGDRIHKIREVTGVRRVDP